PRRVHGASVAIARAARKPGSTLAEVRARSSVDQSEGLLIPRSQVRILPGPFVGCAALPKEAVVDGCLADGDQRSARLPSSAGIASGGRGRALIAVGEAPIDNC